LNKLLAVIESQVSPEHLVQTDGDSFWTIPGITTLGEALSIRRAQLKDQMDSDNCVVVTGKIGATVSDDVEIWGAGVTYLRSRDARKEESGVPDVYQRVYEADRPELFLKSTARRAVGSGATIGIRADCAASVPEPEVAIIVNRYQEIIGLTICNDVTARTIEGENPLYLSQAKIYIGSTSLGPVIKPYWDVADYKSIGIRAHIEREGALVWSAETSLGALHRTLDDLISYLFRCQVLANGVILSTGTGIVPPLDISLQEGDLVSISVDEIGTLLNNVTVIPLDSHRKTLGI